MTITELLLNKHYRGNKAELSRDLNITRNTLRKYEGDEEGNHHFIRNGTTDNPELFTNQSYKAEK